MLGEDQRGGQQIGCDDRRDDPQGRRVYANLSLRV